MKNDPIQAEEVLLFRRRVTVIGVVVVLFFSILASELWKLQILNGAKYTSLSKNNRIRIVPLAGPRGIIYDRNGNALADNRPAFHLQLIREDTPDLEETLTNLSHALDIPYASLRKKVEDNRYLQAFKPIILHDDLDYQKAAIVETYQEEFPGISIVVKAQRYSPHNKVAAHVLGYVGIRSEKQEEELPANKRSSGRFVGKSGIEAVMNAELVGTDGGKQVEVDHVGRELRVLGKPVDPIPGNDIYLTIDLKLQTLVYDLMKGKSGAVIISKPKTGEILAMGSFPSYNPNLFAAGISVRNWNRLLKNPLNPLENKAIQGTYPPGSTFKLLVAYAGLAENVVDENTTFTCNGFHYIKGRKTPYKCWRWKLGGHGVVDLHKAIKESCNVYFYQIAQEMGVDKIHEYASKFQLGESTGIILPNEKSGLIPNTKWKEETFKEQWFLGETPSVAIGQGYVSVTPLQVVNFINIIANGGFEVKPTLIMSDQPIAPKKLNLDQEYLKKIQEGMTAAVNEPHGTALVAHIPEFRAAGKTGTSQVIGHKTLLSLDEEEKSERVFQNHAWFAAYGPVENPEISLVVLVEHGGAGSTGAGPIAKEILQFYYKEIYLPRQTAAHDPSQPLKDRLEAAFDG